MALRAVSCPLTLTAIASCFESEVEWTMQHQQLKSYD